MSSTSIESLWNKLTPQTQEWLRANPGTVILPRSVTESILEAIGHEGLRLEGVDSHGQLPLSPGDQAFLKSMADSAPVGHPVPPAAPAD